MSNDLQISIEKVAGTDHDDRIKQLRDAVFGSEKKYIDDEKSYEDGFDQFQEATTYFIASQGDLPIGVIKVVEDSSLGLPCEEFTTLDPIRSEGNKLAEIGHSIVLPSYRSTKVYMSLMKAAFTHSCQYIGVSHLLGDVFVNVDSGSYFFGNIGFQDFYGPYEDSRFIDSPMSMVILLDIRKVVFDPASVFTGAQSQKLFKFFTRGIDFEYLGFEFDKKE